MTKIRPWRCKVQQYLLVGSREFPGSFYHRSKIARGYNSYHTNNDVPLAGLTKCKVLWKNATICVLLVNINMIKAFLEECCFLHLIYNLWMQQDSILWSSSIYNWWIIIWTVSVGNNWNKHLYMVYIWNGEVELFKYRNVQWSFVLMKLDTFTIGCMLKNIYFYYFMRKAYP